MSTPGPALDAFLLGEIGRIATVVSGRLRAEQQEVFDPALLQARRGAVGTARQKVTASRDALIAALRDVDSARAALDAALAAGRTVDLPQAEQRLTTALATADAARQRLTTDAQALQASQVAMVNANGTASSYARLRPNAPIALLPVRLETRWFARDATSYELRIRIFPDGLHIDSHQPLMTPVEQEVARAYWTTRLAFGPDHAATLAAWHRLSEEFGEARAGWLVAQLDPAGLDGRKPPAGSPPTIPTRPSAPDGWVDPVLARCLPDRWAVVGFARSQRVLLQWTAPVHSALQVSLDADLPGAPANTPVDAGVRWMTDFVTAEAAGMAARIVVDKVIARHLDRVLVFGIAACEDIAASRKRLTDLFAAHAITGAGFPGLGASTNNTESDRSGYRERPRDHAATHAQLTSLQLSRGGNRDAELVARAFGLDPLIWRRLPGAGRVSFAGVEDMHRLLWYASGQRLLQQQIEATVTAEDIAFTRQHFVSRVRARGPLPPLRIDAQPYGLLPVVGLDRWSGPSTDARMRMLVNVLRSIRAGMLRFLDSPHSVATSDDPQGGLLRTLSRPPGSTIRHATAKVFASQQVADQTTQQMRAWWTAAIPQLRTGPVDVALAHGGLRLFQRAIPRTNTTYGTSRPVVSVGADRLVPLPSGVNYLGHLGAGTGLPLAAVRAHQVNGAAERSLLYLLLREAYESRPTFTQQDNGSFLQSLRKLAERPVGELEQLTTDIADLWTDRLDAWATSVATDRLNSFANAANHGVHVGGYGWVENLVPPGEGAVAGGPVVDDPDSAGFLHLPSAAQARTAAVLHGAYLAHTTPGVFAEAFRMELTSDRVRAARALLAGLREGQSLSAVLGYRLERRMVEGGLGQHVPAVRRIATTATGPTDPADPAHDHPARDPATTETVDGVVILFLASQFSLDERLAAQGIGTDAITRIVGLASELVAAFDALSDLLVAEGAHQALSGNASRAAAAFDLMAEGGGAAPDPMVTATPASGTQLGLRVIIPLPAGANTGWPGDQDRVRGVAEPRLNAWAAVVLTGPGGGPASIGFRVRLRPPGDDPELVFPATLADVDVCPLDVVALAAANIAQSPLVALLAHRFAVGAPAGSAVVIEPDVRGSAARSLTDAVVLAYSLRRLVTDSRPLRAADLAQDPSAVGEPPPDGVELTGRAIRTRAALQATHDQLTAAGDPHKWWRAAVLLGAADPDLPTTVDGWILELTRRLAPGSGPADPLADLTRLVGPGVPVLPVFTATNGAELLAAFGDAARQAAAAEGDPSRPGRWLHDTAKTRPHVDRLDLHVALASAFDTPLPLQVAHLPIADGVWAGERLSSPGPRAALLAGLPFATDYQAPLAGLFIDGWTETLPQRTATTGLVFSYDAPKPQAPQAILLAVPADPGRAWQFEDVESALLETLGFAQLRLMTPVGLGALGDYLPALYLGGDLRPDLQGTV